MPHAPPRRTVLVIVACLGIACGDPLRVTDDSTPFDGAMPPAVDALLRLSGPADTLAYEVLVRIQNADTRPRSLTTAAGCAVQVRLFPTPARAGTAVWSLHTARSCPSLGTTSGAELVVPARDSRTITSGIFTAAQLRAGRAGPLPITPLAPGTYYPLATITTSVGSFDASTPEIILR